MSFSPLVFSFSSLAILPRRSLLLNSEKSPQGGGDFFSKLGGVFKSPAAAEAAEKANRAAVGRKVLEAGRLSRSEKRALDGEAQALRKVLALFEDGLLAEDEVELFYSQLKVAERQRKDSQVVSVADQEARERFVEENKGATVALAGAAGLATAAAGIAAVVATGEASVVTEVAVAAFALGGSGLAAFAASREDWLGDVARSAGKAAEGAADAAAASTVAAIEAVPGTVAKAATKAVDDLGDAAEDAARQAVAQATAEAQALPGRVAQAVSTAAKDAIQDAADKAQEAIQEATVAAPLRAAKKVQALPGKVAQAVSTAAKDAIQDAAGKAQDAIQEVVAPVAAYPAQTAAQVEEARRQLQQQLEGTQKELVEKQRAAVQAVSTSFSESPRYGKALFEALRDEIAGADFNNDDVEATPPAAAAATTTTTSGAEAASGGAGAVDQSRGQASSGAAAVAAARKAAAEASAAERKAGAARASAAAAAQEAAEAEEKMRAEEAAEAGELEARRVRALQLKGELLANSKESAEKALAGASAVKQVSTAAAAKEIAAEKVASAAGSAAAAAAKVSPDTAEVVSAAAAGGPAAVAAAEAAARAALAAEKAAAAEAEAAAAAEAAASVPQPSVDDLLESIMTNEVGERFQGGSSASPSSSASPGAAAAAAKAALSSEEQVRLAAQLQQLRDLKVTRSSTPSLTVVEDMAAEKEDETLAAERKEGIAEKLLARTEAKASAFRAISQAKKGSDSGFFGEDGEVGVEDILDGL